jgi:ribosome-binding protein aMBF1 (putative translation factor)
MPKVASLKQLPRARRAQEHHIPRRSPTRPVPGTARLVGARIKERRQALGMTQAQLAEQLSWLSRGPCIFF